MRQPKWRDLGNGRNADVDRLADEGSIPSSSTHSLAWATTPRPEVVLVGGRPRASEGQDTAATRGAGALGEAFGAGRLEVDQDAGIDHPRVPVDSSFLPVGLDLNRRCPDRADIGRRDPAFGPGSTTTFPS